LAKWIHHFVCYSNADCRYFRSADTSKSVKGTNTIAVVDRVGILLPASPYSATHDELRVFLCAHEVEAPMTASSSET
jgi:hypothetical protein